MGIKSDANFFSSFFSILIFFLIPKRIYEIPYARHYNPRFVYFLKFIYVLWTLALFIDSIQERVRYLHVVPSVAIWKDPMFKKKFQRIIEL